MMKRKMIYSVLTICLAVSLAACGEKSSNAAETVKEEEKRDTSYIETFKQLELGESLNSLNEKIGFEPAEDVGKYGITYVWNIGDGAIKADFSGDDTSQEQVRSLDLVYEDEDLINSAVVYKDMDALEAKFNEGLTYEQFKEYMGGVDGVLVSKNRSSTEYVWTNSKLTHVKAAFSVDTNLCTFFNGMT